MGKNQTFAGLDKLAGKKVLLKPKSRYDLVHVESMVKAQQGALVKDLDKTVDYLVLSDLSTGVTVQKQVLALNAKGAGIQVMDGAAMEKMLTPTDAELVQLLKAGREGAQRFNQIRKVDYRAWHQQGVASLTIAAESFDGVELNGLGLMDVAFEQCRFVGCKLANIAIGCAHACDFSDASASPDDLGPMGPVTYRAPGSNAVDLHNVEGSKFCRAQLPRVQFSSDITGADFTEAQLEGARFCSVRYGKPQVKQAGAVFARAKLRGAGFAGKELVAPDFAAADLSGAVFESCHFANANFRGALMAVANLSECRFPGADFSGADLTGANFWNADVSGAKFEGADVGGVNWTGATVAGADFSKARNYDPKPAGGAVGLMLQELDAVVAGAKRLHFSFRIESPVQPEGEEVSVDSLHLRYGWGANTALGITNPNTANWKRNMKCSDALLQLAGIMGKRKIRFETLEISSTKSPKGGKELRELVIKGLEEAFVQSPPPDEELAALTKAYREKDREKNAADREAREKERAAAEKAREKEKKRAEKKIEKAVGGKVKDISTFLTALELRIEKPKIDKATSMLKKSGFQLYNDITDTFMSGVVKSQTDPDLVYACRINHDGTYACCTQNLNICGGLRGSICKHLLVLIIGLVKAGELDPTTIDAWVAKSMHEKAALDKEQMGEIFIRYKGAEAGEVDWRPTETIPEDYYAL